MEVDEAIMTRRSIRKYTNASIPKEILEDLVDVARYAPTWANTNAIHYMFVTDRDLKAQLAEKSDPINAGYIHNAAALFVVVGKRNRSGIDRDGVDGAYYHKSKEWLMLDAGIAIQSLCLAAWNKGIGTLIMGSYDGVAIRECLKLNEENELIALVSAGYPEEAPKAPRRKPVANMLQHL